MILIIFPIAVFLRSIYGIFIVKVGLFIVKVGLFIMKVGLLPYFYGLFYGIIAEFGMFTGFYEIYGDSISIE